MADLDYDGFGPDERYDGVHPESAGRVGRFMNILGATMSLALVAGLAVWGYKLLVRDVTGIPVVQAMEGPMRVQPDDPGGDRAAHQGLAVNRIAAVGEAAPPPDQIVLAPRSVDLDAEDMAHGILQAQPALMVDPSPAPARRDPVNEAVLAAATNVMTTEAELSGEGLIEVIPASVPGVSRSLRPRLRPENLVTVAVQPVAAPASAASPAEIDPSTLAPGSRLVQFGAFDTPERARQVWVQLAGDFGSLMEGRQRVVEEATTGGRTFFRLRAAGFEDLADARRFCAAFIAEDADCIPVLTR